MRRSALRFVVGMILVAVVAGACVSPATPRPTASVPASSVPGALPLVVDTDMAPDDITALASLLRDPAVDIRAITVAGTGEAHCPGGMFVARSIVTMLADREIPIACGNSSPMGPAEEFPAEWRAAVDSGSGLRLVRPAYLPDDRSAPDLLVELAGAEARAGGRLTILTLGTLTNVATALASDPNLASEVRLVSMVGAVGVPGNVTTQPGEPMAEWNAHADPTAVRRVLEAGFDWTLVPLDATNSVPLTAELFDALAKEGHEAGAADLVFELWARNPYMTAGGFYLWDPLAAAVVRDPSIVTILQKHLSVTEGDGAEGGRLREDPAGPAVSVAVAADRPAFEALLLDRLRLGPPRSNAFTAVASVAVSADVGRCDVNIDPPAPPAGLLEVRFTNARSEAADVVVFELGGVTWPVVESYVKTYDPAASPPPVNVLAQVSANPSGSATTYATSPAGQLGVACFSGPPEKPAITLAGPFPIGP